MYVCMYNRHYFHTTKASLQHNLLQNNFLENYLQIISTLCGVLIVTVYNRIEYLYTIHLHKFLFNQLLSNFHTNSRDKWKFSFHFHLLAKYLNNIKISISQAYLLTFSIYLYTHTQNIYLFYVHKLRNTYTYTHIYTGNLFKLCMCVYRQK